MGSKLVLFILNFREVLPTSHKRLCKTTWGHKGPYTTIRDLTQQYGTLQGHKGPYMAIRDLTQHYGTSQGHKGPYGTIW